VSASRLMREGDAWRFIAKEIGNGEWASNTRKCLCAQLGSISGSLCYGITRPRTLIARETRDVMAHRLFSHMQDVELDAGFIVPNGEQQVRVLAALFLALEADDESGRPSAEHGEGGAT
jgi:hypothetical protein